MNTGTLNKLHNTCNEHVLTVTDRIYLDLFTLNVVVNENRLVLIDLNRSSKVVTKLVFVAHDTHCASAKHEGGANKNGISDSLRNLNTVLNLGNRLTLGLGNTERGEDFLKGVAVLRTLDSLAVCADDLNSAGSKRLRKVDSSLSAE